MATVYVRDGYSNRGKTYSGIYRGDSETLRIGNTSDWGFVTRVTFEGSFSYGFPASIQKLKGVVTSYHEDFWSGWPSDRPELQFSLKDFEVDAAYALAAYNARDYNIFVSHAMSGPDTGYGDAGRNTIYGFGGDDVLYGYRNGFDYWSEVSDVLSGGTGADQLQAGYGGGHLYGGQGTDTLIGGNGRDYLFGGDDADYLIGDAFLERPSQMPPGLSLGTGQLSSGIGHANVSLETAIDVSDKFYIGSDPDVAQSDTRPHLKIYGTSHEGDLHYFKVSIGTSGTRLILDIDYGDTNGSSTGDCNTEIYLYSPDGFEIGYNDKSGTEQGGGGSVGNYRSPYYPFELLEYGNDAYLYSVIERSGNYYFAVVVSETSGLPATWELQVTVVDPSAPPTTFTWPDPGDDELHGGPGADILDGRLGDDSLYGGSETDWLFGGDGSDTLDGGAGADSLNGGDGIDLLTYANAPSAIYVDLGHGTATGSDATDDTFAEIENLLGSSFNDLIGGDAVDNSLSGALGDDILLGDGGDDILDGGIGNDTLLGEAGNDTLVGGIGADYIHGGAGRDVADFAGAMAGVSLFLDAVTGGIGGDAQGDIYYDVEGVIGTGYADSLTGNAADNLIAAGDGADSVSGDTGNDTLWGGDGNDSLFGGVGNDTLSGGAGADWHSGGAGRDVVSFADAAAGVVLQLDTVVGGTAGDATGDLYDGVEGVIGTAFQDSLNLNDLDNSVEAGAGDDSIHAGAGDDTLYGDVGDDWLEGGPGADTMSGGAGWDTASYAAATAGIVIDLLTGTTAGDAAGDVVTEIESLIGSAYADVLVASTSDMHLSGGAGNDTIMGGSGNDTINGGTGSDTLDGGDGDDTLTFASSNGGVLIDFGTGTVLEPDGSRDSFSGFETVLGSPSMDTFVGSEGDDTLTGDRGDLLHGGAGADLLVRGTAIYEHSPAGVNVDLMTRTATGGHAEGDTFSSVSSIIGSDFADTLLGDGNSNWIDGGPGDDVIYGGPAWHSITDELYGGEGNDELSAGSPVHSKYSRWLLYGGPGDDSLTGGNRYDALFGGAGDDLFDGPGVYYGGPGDDTFLGRWGANPLYGDDGIDTADYSASGAPVLVTLGITASGGHAEGDQLYQIENLIGSAFADVLVGDSNANTVAGGPGEDSLDGGDGIDTVDYSDAPAESGFIGVIADLSREVTLRLSGEVDDTITNFENVIGSEFSDLIVGDDRANSILGGRGRDNIRGEGGDDVIYGGEGFDVVAGGEGADTLSGGDEFADLVSYARIQQSLTFDLTSEFRNPDGSVNTANQSSAPILEDVLDGFEGFAGANDFENTFIADGFANRLFLTGGQFDDTFSGGANNDSFIAGRGHDIMYGNEGRDGLRGGNGDDDYFGGADGDFFFFEAFDSSAGDDIIHDLEAGLDEIRFVGGGVVSLADLQFSTVSAGGNVSLDDTLITYDVGPLPSTITVLDATIQQVQDSIVF